MAAAREAKAESSKQASTSRPVEPNAEVDMVPEVEPQDEQSDLFPASPEAPPSSSPFFSILTSPNAKSLPVAGAPSRTAPLPHLPHVKNQEELEQRIRAAFGPDVESPDDIVLRARQGRGGVTTAPEIAIPATKPPAVKAPTAKAPKKQKQRQGAT
jgi:hypothetical protein